MKMKSKFGAASARENGDARAVPLSYRDARRIEEIIRAHADVNNAERRVNYHPEWDDVRVTEFASKELGRKLTEVQVRYFRAQQLGRLRRQRQDRGTGSTSGPLLSRLAELLRNDQALEHRLASIEGFLADHGYRIPDASSDNAAEQVPVLSEPYA